MMDSLNYFVIGFRYLACLLRFPTLLQGSVCTRPASPGHWALLVCSGLDEPWQVWKHQEFVCSVLNKMYPVQYLLLGLLPVL